MNTLKQRLLTNWHLMRIFRAAIGMMMLVMGIQNKDWAIGLFSIFFLYQAVTDTGCCSTQGCYSPPHGAKNDTAHEKQTEEVDYEEVK